MGGGGTVSPSHAREASRLGAGSRIGAGRSGDGGARAGAIIAGCLGGGRTGVLGRAYSILGEVPPKAAPQKLAEKS